ncbi:MAG: HAD family hydrolase [Candidatus Margulisbacteria bacterium]|nr:HAD family hydrolase [Candidatus Margulisiibacteriota bacterium]
MNIFLIDVDNTLARFQPTAELYKNTLLKLDRTKYSLLGYGMIVLLKVFWWLPAVVTFQRQVIMSLLAAVDTRTLEAESEKIAARVSSDYEQGFKRILDRFKQSGDKVFLLTHCPAPIAQKLKVKLNFDGEYSIRVEKRPVVLNKLDVLRRIRADNRGATIVYFADDLIDLSALLAADRGFLVNASPFTRLVAGWFFKRIGIAA